MDTVAFEQHLDVVGHSFLETIDLDIMEQTIIDTVVAEISSSEHTVMFEPVLPRSYSEPVLKSVIEAVDVEGLLEQFEEASQNMEERKDKETVVNNEVPVFTLYTETDMEERKDKETVVNNEVPVFTLYTETDMEERKDKETVVNNEVPVFTLYTETDMEERKDKETVVNNEVPVFSLYTETDMEEPLAPKKDRNDNIEKKELTKEVIQKLKTCTKSKSAVMLPMMVPAKRGRGRAMTRGHPVALPAGCTPLRLQRVMMQHEHLKGSIAVGDTITNEVTDPVNNMLVKVTGNLTEGQGTWSSSCVTRSDSQILDLNSFEHILDHDYSKNIDKVNLSINCEKNIEKVDLSVNCDNSENVSPADIEEGEIIEKEETVDSGRSFRGSRSREDLMEDHSNLFDKIPSYYTALSIPRKQFRKTASCVTGRGGMTVHDYIERDSSPIRDTSTYSKLPEYCSSFTNSTRYDTMTEFQNKKYNDDRDSKISSGYSSENHSPDLSVRPDRSRSRSSSCSRSRSKSAHSLPRRYRQSSYSSCSGYSSSGSSCSGSVCSNSSCCRSSARSISCSTCGSRSSSAASRSMSRSASRSLSRSASRSLSRSPSRSVSRSPERWRSKDRSHSRSSMRSGSSSEQRSHDRSWKRERDMRGERTRRNSRKRSSIRTLPKASHRARSRRRVSRSPRSGSYSSSRSRSRGYRSRSRSDSRDRKYARNEALEKRREERRRLREEKEQQMKERRIVYVGGLPRNYTKRKLQDNFSRFGPIEAVQLHFREHGDNYGFVTFTYTCDAFAAIEKGNKIPALKDFDLCFGGRRQFCDVEYADLDGNKEVEEEYESKPQRRNALDFDELLRMAKAGLKKS